MQKPSTMTLSRSRIELGLACMVHSQRVLSTHMGNTYPNHNGNYYYRNHTLYCIGTLDPLALQTVHIDVQTGLVSSCSRGHASTQGGRDLFMIEADVFKSALACHSAQKPITQCANHWRLADLRSRLASCLFKFSAVAPPAQSTRQSFS